ncbi:MAG: hypothetical protein AAFX99_19505, partial [Myxococcota bacterium]
MERPRGGGVGSATLWGSALSQTQAVWSAIGVMANMIPLGGALGLSFCNRLWVDMAPVTTHRFTTGTDGGVDCPRVAIGSTVDVQHRCGVCCWLK